MEEVQKKTQRKNEVTSIQSLRIMNQKGFYVLNQIQPFVVLRMAGCQSQWRNGKSTVRVKDQSMWRTYHNIALENIKIFKIDVFTSRWPFFGFFNNLEEFIMCKNFQRIGPISRGKYLSLFPCWNKGKVYKILVLGKGFFSKTLP